MRIFGDQSQIEAFDHGVSAYETIAALVVSVPYYCDLFTINTNAVGLASKLPEGTLFDYIDKAQQTFWHDLPRTADVVRDSSRRYYNAMSDYAVCGAALARQFQLDGVE